MPSKIIPLADQAPTPTILAASQPAKGGGMAKNRLSGNFQGPSNNFPDL